MVFHWKNKESEYFNFYVEQKADFYYEKMVKGLLKADNRLKKFENEIKLIILTEINSYEYAFGRCQRKAGKEFSDIRKLQSDLGHLTQDWSVDWAWIMHHIILDFQNLEVALNLLKESDDVQVYKWLPLKYYPFAEEMYLKDMVTREPKVFKLKQLMKNGHGFEKNVTKPIAGASLWDGFNNDYWDETELNKFEDDYVWDIEKKVFMVSSLERKVKRNSKIKITIGDKTDEI